MKGIQRLASAAKGTLWLLRATGLREHLAKLQYHLNDIDSRVRHVASESAVAIQVADNVGRLEKRISDVMADVSSQHATTVRVAESVQRLGKHIVDVAANNLTNGRLSEQFQKLEKYLNELAAGHLSNGRLTDQFQRLERHINEVASNGLIGGRLAEQFRRLEAQIETMSAGPQGSQELREPLKKLQEQLAELAATETRLSKRLETLECRLEEIAVDGRRHQDQTRWLQAQDLRAYERRVHSPNGEDGIIQEVLHRIGVEARYFVALGVKSGTENNCARLVLQENWIGLFVESDPIKFKQLSECYHGNWGVRCVCAAVSSRTLEPLLAENGVPFNLDVLSIAIDGNDYWLWNALSRWRPRLITIGYNSHYLPSQKWVMQENLNHESDGTSYYGASLASLTALGRKKGYSLVATDSSGSTAFFVRDDLAIAERFLDPVIHYHYSPPSFGPFLGGYPLGSGPNVQI